MKIEETAGMYIEWRDVLAFFSKKGYIKRDD
jgi:hypothetical protein